MIKHKKSIVIIFMIITLLSTVAQFAVSVNYNMVDYLPKDSPSMEAMDLMEDEFDEPVENARVMVKEVSITEALTYKEELESIEGVSQVTWLDDVVDLKVPLEMGNSDTIESYYQNNSALYSLHIDEGYEVEATDEIYQLIGEENAVSGEAVNTATSQKMAGSESMYAGALLVPIIILILILSTNSWMEPVFFLTAIGVSVLINLGTNIFIGEVSFVTQSVAPILQLAVSLDYAIFLLHSFSDFRKEVSDPKQAMQLAIKRSFPAIVASASTTFFGFTALTFMDFGIGADLGLNLLKGILLSFISVMVFLPALTLMFYHWIDRTQHRSFVPDFKNIGKRVMKLRIPSLVLIVLIIVPAFLAQSHTSFIYGTGEHPQNTRAGQDVTVIQEEFGKNMPMVLLVPEGDRGKEEELVQELEDLPQVSSVLSYVNTVSAAIPPAYLEESVTESFYSGNYARITLYTDTDAEGEEAFSLIEEVQAKADSYYDETHLLGESVTLYDMKNIVQDDNKLVNWMTILTVTLVLLVTFKSISIPLVLLLTIQASVWVNLSFPYFMETPLVYVGYLLISTIQLAATVDYAILFTENYNHLRKEMSARPAIKKTIDDKIFAIFVSASILSSVGFILWVTSSNPIVSSIGLLLGRGALLAFIMVVFVLPALLVVLDYIIKKTTWKANFYKEK
ncbi:efflux RND transporter permease subunit [Halobacillus karajensis]|uniref:Membrane protein YdfJ n=1 Tax=Halobacillus karajensis TaxID=195088 RepID=A0A024P677_9BACI|nr:MMPL family transporter [Halobacillus karajensis]CDQ20678.1 Membrane protein YdfJ [Halobacillus karajensis]CDQ23852.1 Membrane protein YdfJ [Halobacillus karajensis]CDQ27330.1 Membrane protein YdfJ [Halobacillus karajensis]